VSKGRIYIAGPLFNEAERWAQAQIEKWAAEAGWETFLPQRDAGALNSKDDVKRIYLKNREAIENADLVVANLNGTATDEGTAWEVGYAVAKAKIIVGLFSDWRKRFVFHDVGIMVECGLEKLCRSPDELKAFLQSYSVKPK